MGNPNAAEPICSGSSGCSYCGCAKSEYGARMNICDQCPVRCGSPRGVESDVVVGGRCRGDVPLRRHPNACGATRRAPRGDPRSRRRGDRPRRPGEVAGVRHRPPARVLAAHVGSEATLEGRHRARGAAGAGRAQDRARRLRDRPARRGVLDEAASPVRVPRQEAVRPRPRSQLLDVRQPATCRTPLETSAETSLSRRR